MQKLDFSQKYKFNVFIIYFFTFKAVRVLLNYIIAPLPMVTGDITINQIKARRPNSLSLYFVCGSNAYAFFASCVTQVGVNVQRTIKLQGRYRSVPANA